MNHLNVRKFRVVALSLLSLILLSSVSASAQSNLPGTAAAVAEKESASKQQKDTPTAVSTSAAHRPADDGEGDQANATPLAIKPTASGEKVPFIRDLLRDQKSIWTSPFHISKGDAKWVGALAATTTVLLLTDRPLPLQQRRAEDILETSSQVSKLGTGYSTFGFAGGMYLMGKITHNERAAETGLLATEAIINTAVVTSTFKIAFRRERPSADSGKGRFWTGGSSFPSGHAGSAWALATVVAQEYKDNPWIRIGAYGYATAVSMARLTGRNHFASDVFVGSAIGYLTGRLVVRKHAKTESTKKVTVISPYINHATRAYGMQGSITF